VGVVQEAPRPSKQTAGPPPPTPSHNGEGRRGDTGRASIPAASHDPNCPRLLAAAALLLLGGCAFVDADQARICRTALPALEPDGARLALVRTEVAPSGVRIDYRASLGNAPAVQRFATCRFAPTGPADLLGITTDRGEVPGATIFLLKRYFIDTPEGVVADPGPATPDADLPELPRPLAHGVQHLIGGLPGAAVYGLLAAAYGLLFGLVQRINLAFGEIAAIGAAAAGIVVAGFASDGLTASLLAVPAGVAIALAVSAFHGAVVGHAAFVLVPAARTRASLIATVGLSLALSEYLRLTGGPTPAWIPPLGADPWPVARGGDFVVTVIPAAILTAAIGLGAGAGLVAFLRLSRFGRDWRAGCDDPLAAALCGVDPRRLLLLTLAISGALAGLAGALVAVRFGALGFAGGFGLGLKALAAAILGGLGSVPGALVGGLVVGAAETLWSAWFPIAWRDLAIHVMLVGAIVLRPEGLFGPRGRPDI